MKLRRMILMVLGLAFLTISLVACGNTKEISQAKNEISQFEKENKSTYYFSGDSASFKYAKVFKIDKNIQKKHYKDVIVLKSRNGKMEYREKNDDGWDIIMGGTVKDSIIHDVKNKEPLYVKNYK